MVKGLEFDNVIFYNLNVNCYFDNKWDKKILYIVIFCGMKWVVLFYIGIFFEWFIFYLVV